MKNSAGGKTLRSSLERELNHYEILLVRADATDSEIRESYERLRRLWEDGPGMADSQGVDRLHVLGEAYRVLSDSRLRKEYDRHLLGGADAVVPNPGPAPETLRALEPWKKKAVWGLLGTVLLCSGLFVALESLPREDAQQEAALLRQLYPPAPKRIAPPEKEFDLSLLQSLSPRPMPRETPPETGSLLRDADASTEGGEKQEASAASSPESDLLRDTPTPAPVNPELHAKPSPDAPAVTSSGAGSAKGKAADVAGVRRERIPLQGAPSAKTHAAAPAVPATAPSKDLRPDLLRSSPEPVPAEVESSAAPGGEGVDNPSHVNVAGGSHAPSSRDMGERILGFLNGFLSAFERKDLDSLDRCHAKNATEDGEPWSSQRTAYLARFESAERVRHEMTVEQWKVQKDGMVAVAGGFRLRYENKDGGTDERSGTFELTLKDTGSDFQLVRVKRKGGEGGDKRSRENRSDDILDFLNRYIRAYEERDLERLMTFFEPDATENGEHIGALQRVYEASFRGSRRFEYDIDVGRWHATSEGVNIAGRFRLKNVAANGSTSVSGGPIQFLLSGTGKDFKIKKLDYKIESSLSSGERGD